MNRKRRGLQQKNTEILRCYCFHYICKHQDAGRYVFYLLNMQVLLPNVKFVWVPTRLRVTRNEKSSLEVYSSMVAAEKCSLKANLETRNKLWEYQSLAFASAAFKHAIALSPYSFESPFIRIQKSNLLFCTSVVAWDEHHIAHFEQNWNRRGLQLANMVKLSFEHQKGLLQSPVCRTSRLFLVLASKT